MRGALACDSRQSVSRGPKRRRIDAVDDSPARVPFVHADALFEGFVEVTYAYRFGPPGHDVVAATLRELATGAILAAAHCFPCGLPAVRESGLGWSPEPSPQAFLRG
jgi:hypothetical protein